RATRHVLREFVEHIQVFLHAQITGNPFEHTRNTLHTQATGHAFAARFVAEIAAAIHRPGNHASIGGQEFDHARTNDRPGLFDLVEIEWRIEQRSRERAAFGTAHDNRAQIALRAAIASVAQNLAQGHPERYFDHLW